MKIVLVEDNIVQQDLMDLYVQDCGYEIISTYPSAEAAEKGLKDDKPDLVLIDINLEGQKSGVELANEIKAKWSVPVIFITSQTEFGILDNAVKQNPLDILIKPIQFEQFKASLMLADSKISRGSKTSEIAKFSIKDDYLVFKNGHLFERALLSDLVFVEGMGNYFTLCFEHGKVVVKGTLINIESSLPEDQFARINRSIIVSLPRIKSFNQKRIFMDNGKEFVLSKKASDTLMNKLMG